MSNSYKMNNVNLLRKYALNYLSKYNSTKKNLEQILKNKIMRMKNIEISEKDYLYKYINKILNNLESNKIINDESFASNKILSLSQQGKSEVFIKYILQKKGVDKKIIYTTFRDFEKNNSNWKIESAKKFARKKKLGQFGNLNNKEKDLAKMSRAGFEYQIAVEVLGYD